MTRNQSLGAVVLASFLLFSCASDAVRSDLERGRALSASGRLADAYQTLQQSSRSNPGNAQLRDAATAARERYGNFLLQQAVSAQLDGRTEVAEGHYKRLAGLQGFEERAADGMQSLAQGQKATPPPAPLVSSSAVAPASAPVLVKEAAPTPVKVAVPAPVQAPVRQPKPLAETAAPLAKPVVVNARQATGIPVVPEDPLQKRVTLEFRDASVRSMFDAITRASGLNVIFDRDVSPDLRTTVYLRNTTIRAAIDKIVLTSGLAWRSLDESTLLVYSDESTKQNDYQALTVRSFQLSNADAKFVASSLRTVLKFRDLVVDEKLNMIVVRDTPSALEMAEKLIALHDVAEPEVMLEVTILEISKGTLQRLGVEWPGSMSLTPLARSASSVTTTAADGSSTSSARPLTLRDLWNLSPGTLGMSIDSLTLNASATDTDFNVLANPRIRAKNREKARILIGERVPNVSSTTSNGVVNQNVTYVDVGLKLDVEPQVFPGNEIGLKITLEVSSINSVVENKTSGLVAYRIGTRNASTVLRLKDGENQVLAGLIQDTDKKTISKVPLLGDIPVLGRLFRSDSDDKGKTELVLSITPRLIRGNNRFAPDANGFDAGTASSVRGRRDASEYSTPEPSYQPQVLIPVQPAVGSQHNLVDSEARQFGGSRD